MPFQVRPYFSLPLAGNPTKPIMNPTELIMQYERILGEPGSPKRDVLLLTRGGSVVVSTSACHAGGRGSLPGPGALVDCVKTWLSTLEIVYLCVFRMRH